MFNGQFAEGRGGPQGGPESGHGGGLGGGYFGHTGGGEGWSAGASRQWSAAVRKVDAGGYHGAGQQSFHGGPHPHASDSHHVPHHVDATPHGDHGVAQPHAGAAKVGYYGDTHAPQDAPTFQHLDHAPYWH